MIRVDRESGMAATVFQQVLPPGDKVSQQMFEDFEIALYKHLRD